MLVSKFLFFPKIPSSISATAAAFPSNSRRDLFVFSNLSDENSNSNQSIEPEIQLKPEKFRASPQLARWSRARSIRSGHRFHRPPLLTKTVSPTSPETSSSSSDDEESDGGKIQPPISSEYDADYEDSEQEDHENATARGKPIYMVSDGTGWTAEHTVNAALGQFENCLVDRGCPVNTHLFSGVQDVDKLLEIIKQAAREGALLLYTLVDPSMAESAKEACKVWDVPATDILGPTTEAIAAHLGVAPSGIPRGAPGRKAPLTAEYFRRIEAIDFTIKQDDGAQPQNIIRADIVLVGVSRTGKTPLSIYLAQKGYKVANIPIVMGVDLPKTLFQIKQEKIFGLTINPVVLQTIRRARAKTLGFNGDTRNNYSEMDYVREELEYANRIYSRNPMWPVIEVTGKAIEETAAVIVRMFHDRKQKFSMPRISRRY